MQRMVLALRRLLGLNNLLPLHDFAKTEFVGRTGVTETFLSEAENIDITDEFHVRRRQGATKQVTGNIHSLWSDGEICLYRQGTNLKRLFPDYSNDTLRSNLTSLRARMEYLSLLGKVYYSDGIDTGIIENRQARSWGLNIPPAPEFETISGFMKAGDYQFAIAYVRSDGQVSGSTKNTITLTANSGIRIKNIIQSNDPTVQYIDVYLSTPNGYVLYFYDKVASDTSTIDIISNRLRSQLPFIGTELDKIPAGDIIEHYNARIYIAKNNVIWYSEPFAYELYKPRLNYSMFDENVQLIAVVDDGLFVATDNETIFLKGDNPPFKKTTVAGYGALKGTKQYVSGELIGKGLPEQVALWVSPEGICMGTDGGKFENLTDKHFSFPETKTGTSLFRQSRGINQFIVSFIDAENSEKIYE